MKREQTMSQDPNVNGKEAPNVDAAAPPVPATPEDRIAALQAERDEMKDRMLRIAAEFENWKKRARKEQSDAVAQARESVLKDVLEVADNLERAIGAQSQAGGNGVVDGAAVVKGVNLVLRLFQQKLERYEVRPFEAAGQPFDPRVHEAISKVESANVPAGSVATELQKGYRVGERLLRPAMVSVSTGPGSATTATTAKTTKTKPSEG
jgi:molecular chaperone GrpE